LVRSKCMRPLWVCAVRRRHAPASARPTRRTAPAGSHRSSHGGNEMAYMSSTESRVFSRCGPRLQLEPSKPLHTRAGPSKEAILRILGMIASLLGRAQQSTPEARRGAPYARGIDGESACRATMAMLWMRFAAGLPACEGRSSSPLVFVCPVQSTLRILKIRFDRFDPRRSP